MRLALADLLDDPLRRSASPSGVSVPVDFPASVPMPLRSSNSPQRREGDLLMSYPKWCALLVANVLKTRTPFASYLSKSISLSQGGRSTLAPSFFPVPVPYLDAFHRMPAGLSVSKRRQIHLKRAVHVMCMGLNFWHSGGKFDEESLLQREPSRFHRCLYGRLVSLVRADGPASSFSIKKTGRKLPNLIARLGELSEVLTKQGSSNPYEKAFAGVDCKLDEDDRAALTPYKDLDPSRLLLHGRGHWDVSEFLSDYMVMPYKEPKVLEASLLAGERPAIRDPVENVVRLAKIWDVNNLLYVHKEAVHPDSLVKIFNCHKSSTHDRQIGDRRGRNSLECRVVGPSKQLPSGIDIQDIVVEKGSRLFLSVTDRRDFYHQIAVTEARARSNTLGPGIPMEMLNETTAFSTFLLNQSMLKRSRLLRGDDLDKFNPTYKDELWPGEGNVWVGFRSILQGDHAGVEICTEAHTTLLQNFGLLHASSRLVASSPLVSSQCLDGLVIDDYFCVSKEPVGSDAKYSEAARRYNIAQEAYSSHELLGSPHKDIVAEKEGKVIGAYVNSSDRAINRGLVTLAAPAEKRLSMSFLSLALCALTHTTDALHLCMVGSWVSMLGYRRPMMSILDRSFNLVNNDRFDANHPKLLPLPRPVANEMVLLAVLVPLMMTDLAADFEEEVYATDASMKMGAVCSAVVGKKITGTLWRTCKSKGAYTRLLTPPEVLMRRLEIFEEHSSQGQTTGLCRPLAYTFDFLEVFAGSSKVTKFVASLGVPVGPPIDITFSEEFDMASCHLLRWLTFLVSERRVKSIMLEPPCTTFSIMRRPRLRSGSRPLGFDVKDPLTLGGNLFACRSGVVSYTAARHGVVSIWETPFSSYMRHLPCWKAVGRLPEAKEVRTDSCCFGSPHLKSFRFLCVNADVEPLRRRCQCVENHVPVEGSYTKSSAVYVDGLAETLAKVLVDAARVIDEQLESEEKLEVKGFENQLVNEVALTAKWSVASSWSFKRESHINILEEAALLRLVSYLGTKMRPLRAVALVDSFVCRGATAKGRSSSRSLSAILRKVNSRMVAFGIYLVTPFCPTRWNVADDPSREVPLRDPIFGFDLQSLSDQDLHFLASLKPTRRWVSNWIRLVLLASGPPFVDFSDRSIYRAPRLSQATYPDPPSGLNFDATLGFPGEGPDVPNSLIGFLTFSLLPVHGFALCPAGCCWLLWGAAVPRPAAMPVFPTTSGDVSRARLRSGVDELPGGRPVLARTGTLRNRYFEVFAEWVLGNGICLDELLFQPIRNVDEINALLTRYGRELFKAGKTYNQYAETINELTSRAPPLRRFVQAAWDLGYTWKKFEPSEHHTAMPGHVLLAILSVCLTWGWTRVAGIFALMWGALLRPGEACSASRGDLLLPDDLDGGAPFALLSIKEPKTRFSNARHQSAKLDIPDLLSVVRLAFKDLKQENMLWPFSAQTLRNRLRVVLSACWLPTESGAGLRALDLGSFRSGGATWIIQVTEDGDLLQRRGRWANRKMMEIYVQEVSALIYLKKVPEKTKDRVVCLAAAFLPLLDKAWEFTKAKIPGDVWYILFPRC